MAQVNRARSEFPDHAAHSLRKVPISKLFCDPRSAFVGESMPVDEEQMHRRPQRTRRPIRNWVFVTTPLCLTKLKNGARETREKTRKGMRGVGWEAHVTSRDLTLDAVGTRSRAIRRRTFNKDLIKREQPATVPLLEFLEFLASRTCDDGSRGSASLPRQTQNEKDRRSPALSTASPFFSPYAFAGSLCSG